MNNITTIQNITNFTNNTLLDNIINITPNDPNCNSNIYINNTFKINYTKPFLNNKEITNINAGIGIKDRYDGYIKDIYLNNNDLYIIPQDFINNKALDKNKPVKFIREDDNDIIKNFLQNEDNYLSYGNINIINNSYIRFLDNNLSNNIIGFRHNKGNIEFKNKNDINWTILNNNDFINDFYNLTHININKTSIHNKQYIKFDKHKNLINSNLNIFDDNIPKLGGNLYTNNYNIQFTNNSSITDNIGNKILQFSATNNNSNYLKIEKKKYKNENLINLYATSDINKNVNMAITTHGNGDLNINLIEDKTLNNMGDFIIRANEFNLADINIFNMSSGKFVSSIEYITLNNINSTNIELNTETLVLEINGNNNTYYLSIIDGINGQKGNIIYETNGLNNTIELRFIDKTGKYKKIGTGSGLSNKLILNTSGQSIMLQFLSFNNENNNRWQILNTGCIIK